MKELSDTIYTWLYTGLGLQTVGIIVGLLLIIVHVFALVKAPSVMEKLKSVPRSQNIGTVFLTIDFIWAWIVATSMELGDFERLRWLAQFSVPLIYVAMLFWVNDYLGARSIGIFLLLATCPVLDAAFLQEPDSRVLLSIICYLWITLGLFWIGMPYTMRDQITWATRSARRYKGLAIAGAAYGAVVLITAFVFYKGY
jgi:hypothetical protein